MGKKSSSSLKRKRSKSSSKAKASSKSKSGKHKSKKVRRREVSVSSSDYNDSKSLSAYSSSEDSYSYKSKRDRSRLRKDVKGRKKKSRRRSYSPDSSEDSLYDRKRKKAKRKREHEGREKPRQKKKIRRETSVSPTSSGSLSCSTCQGESASIEDSQYQSRRGRSERKEKGKQRSERRRSGSEKSSRYRARSRSRESSFERNGEKYMGENNSRRLRSVITVAREVEESREFSRDDTKEEIVDDHDYPCRSNDSNDGLTKRELDLHTLPGTEEELRVDAETGDVNADSAWTRESMKNKTSKTSGDDVVGGELESILRQKALENLRKFRGGIQSTAKASNQKNNIVSQVNQPISDNIDVVQGKSNINNAAVGTKFDNQTFVEETSVSVGKRNLIAFPRNNERLNMDKDTSGSAIHLFACAPEKVIDADNPSDKSTNYRTNKPELTTPESRHDSIRSHLSPKQENSKNGGTFEASRIASRRRNDNVNNIKELSSAVPKPSSHGSQFGHNHLKKGQDEVKEPSESELKQASDSHEPPNPEIPVIQGDVEIKAAIQSTDDSGGHVDESSNSATKYCIENSSLENNSATLQDGSNQGSQFEQKTMNVMRGGEMVQVSYKVYIPKKTPALARRQLKR